LLPGLIDMHSHPTFYWNDPDYQADPNNIGADKPIAYFTPAMITLLAASRLREALVAGITTIRDTGCVGQIGFDLRRAVKRGLIPGPKLHVAGRMIVPSGGHAHNLSDFCNQADGPVGFRRAVREEIRAGADFIKLASDHNDMTQEELDTAVDEAHRQGKKVACHAAFAPAPLMAIRAGADDFEHGPPTDREIDMAVEKGIAWVPTINVNMAYLDWFDRRRRACSDWEAEPNEQEYANMARFMDEVRTGVERGTRAGLRIVAGTDSWVQDVPFGALPDEMAWLARCGCSPMQAIQAGTGLAAETMGRSDIGALEPGRAADIIVLEGDPLADIDVLHKVTLVIQDGQVVETRQSHESGCIS
jgi:imidazolonepropionase-like amidohydrolase